MDNIKLAGSQIKKNKLCFEAHLFALHLAFPENVMMVVLQPWLTQRKHAMIKCDRKFASKEIANEQSRKIIRKKEDGGAAVQGMLRAGGDLSHHE